MMYEISPSAQTLRPTQVEPADHYEGVSPHGASPIEPLDADIWSKVVELGAPWKYAPDSTAKHIALDPERPRFVKDDEIVSLDPQGVFGDLGKVGRVLNGEGRSDLGGEIPFVIGLALGTSKAPLNLQQEDGATEQRFPKVTIISQIAYADQNAKYHNVFGGEFSSYQQYLMPGHEESAAGAQPVRIVRLPLHEEQKISGISNLDKLEGASEGHNSFYRHLEEWARTAARVLYNEDRVPRYVRAEHGIGAYAMQFFLDELQQLGVPQGSVLAIGQVHASGESSAAVRIDQALRQGATGREAREAIHAIAHSENGFAWRMIAERASFRDLVVASSSLEASEMTSGWHRFPVQGLPMVDEASVRVLEPGIHPAFYHRASTAPSARMAPIESLMPLVEEKLQTIKSNFEDPDLNMVIVRGRWDPTGDRKGFLNAVRAFAEDKELRASTNLLLCVGDSRYAATQGLPLQDETQFPSRDAKGALTTMGHIRELLEKDPDLKKHVIAYPLTDHFEQAATLQLMGDANNGGTIRYVGGSFSPKEPHGLVLDETAGCGVAVVASRETGAAVRYQENRTIECFEPADPLSLARALKATFASGDALLPRQLELAQAISWDSRAQSFVDTYQAFTSNRASGDDALTPVVFDLNNPRDVESLVPMVEAYFLTSRYADKVFTDDYVRELLKLPESYPVGDEARAGAQELVLLELGIEKAYDTHIKIPRLTL
jgi:glycosyltransferase involved in cell wall biosynthesis